MRRCSRKCVEQPSLSCPPQYNAKSTPRCPFGMFVVIFLVATSAILHGTDAAGKKKEETKAQPAAASESRSPYSTSSVVKARKSGRFTLDVVMKAAAEGSGGVIEDWIRAGGSVDDRDTKAPRRG